MKGEQTGILGSYQNKYYVCSNVFYICHVQAEKYAGKDTNCGKKIALLSFIFCSNWLLLPVLKYHQKKKIGKWFCLWQTNKHIKFKSKTVIIFISFITFIFILVVFFYFFITTFWLLYYDRKFYSLHPACLVH